METLRTDGIDFPERLKRLRPIPVVVISTLAERGSEAAFRGIALGAVDFIAKPKLGAANTMHDYVVDISDKIRARRLPA